MRLLFLLTMIPVLAFAHDNPIEHKKGFVIGMGGTYSRYTFPSDYNGLLKDKIDNSASLYGGVLQVGYDVVFWDRLLLGVRAEGMISDTLGTGNNSENVLKGKTRSANGLARMGILFPAKLWDLVGDPANLLFEPFVEGGLTSGHKSFTKVYDPAGTDIYRDNLEEEYQGTMMNIGVNMMNGRGGFFEVKGSFTKVTNAHQNFSGTKVENGGAATSTNRIENDNKEFFTWMFVFGQHF